MAFERRGFINHFCNSVWKQHVTVTVRARAPVNAVGNRRCKVLAGFQTGYDRLDWQLF